MPGWMDAAGDAVRGAIRAYHGSPHAFDTFDARKIGTGEGAQAYGHGIYFAGSEDTAKFYRDSVKVPTEEERQLLQGIRRASSRLMREREDASTALAQLADAEGTPAPGWGTIKDPPDTHEARKLKKDIARLQIAIDKSLAEEGALYGRVYSRPGNMYEVEIGYPEETLLDWDAPMSQQPGVVKRAYGDSLIGMDRPGDGGRIYRDIATRLGEDIPDLDGISGEVANHAAAMELLGEGIPGIRYFDAPSRRRGKGTRNYVMFPGTEDSIRILRKYGLLPATLGAEGLVNQQP